MLSRFIGDKATYSILLTCYCAIAIALPFKLLVLSLASLLGLLVFFLEFNVRNYAEKLKNNKALWVLLVFIMIHLLSFFWSENKAYFLKDLNVKLSVYFLPFLLIFHPPRNRKHFQLIVALFLFSLIFFSAFNFVSYFVFGKGDPNDIRSMSLFVSHIRFGLMLVLGMLFCVYWIFSSLRFKWLAILILLWFLTYNYFSEVFSSYLILLCLFFVYLLLRMARSKRRFLWFGITTLFFALLAGGTYFIYHKIQGRLKIPTLAELPKFTSEGNPYQHDLTTAYFRNGTHVYSNVCGPELNREWSKVSKFDLMDTNQLGFIHYYTLIQYMASKGMRKDAENFKKLSIKEIHLIEKGVANCQVTPKGFWNRAEVLLSEFEDNDPNGKTIQQRFEYLKNGWRIFRTSVFIGVGSGDLADEFERSYQLTQSKLKPENRLRTHNQFFTYFISFGILGGFVFIWFLLSSFKMFSKKELEIGIYFLTIILVSFISEDTLETQAGATFFGFFFGLFMGIDKSFLSKKDA